MRKMRRENLFGSEETLIFSTGPNGGLYWGWPSLARHAQHITFVQKARLRSWTPYGAPLCTDSPIDQTRVYTADYADGNLRILLIPT